jgi:anti-anti-sigma regulatory factor
MSGFWQKILGGPPELYSIKIIDDAYVSIAWNRSRYFVGPATLEIREAVEGYISQGRRLFLFDLRKAQGLNSWSVGFLFGSVASIQKAGGRAVLLLRKNKVWETLELIGVADHFTIEFEQDRALDSLCGPSSEGRA